jgi:hypothetical protein
MCGIVNAIFYVLRGGITWRLLPSDFFTLADRLSLVRGLTRRFGIREDQPRFWSWPTAKRVGRAVSPSGAIIDSQSVKTTESGGPRGYDAGKKVNGCKRHALVTPMGEPYLLNRIPAQAPRHVYRCIEELISFIGVLSCGCFASAPCHVALVFPLLRGHNGSPAG